MLVVEIDDNEYMVPIRCAARATAGSPTWWKSRDMAVGAHMNGTSMA